MNKALMAGLNKIVFITATLLIIATGTTTAVAQNKFYTPIPLPKNGQIIDNLTDQDIPTGQGGFARDYSIKLNKGDNITIDLSSDNFDTIVTLLGPDGSTVGENDDGPDGTTNSLLFSRIMQTGTYVIRVHAFGETGVGQFKLKVTKLLPAK
jgi:hypothetical protein